MSAYLVLVVIYISNLIVTYIFYLYSTLPVHLNTGIVYLP